MIPIELPFKNVDRPGSILPRNFFFTFGTIYKKFIFLASILRAIRRERVFEEGRIWQSEGYLKSSSCARIEAEIVLASARKFGK
jgi:hypothetical protein